MIKYMAAGAAIGFFAVWFFGFMVQMAVTLTGPDLTVWGTEVRGLAMAASLALSAVLAFVGAGIYLEGEDEE